MISNKRAKQMIESVTYNPGDDWFMRNPLPWERAVNFFHDNSVARKDSRVMRKIRRGMPKAVYLDVLDVIEMSEGGSRFEITTEHGGEHQDECYLRVVKGIYIDQSCGMCGDDCSGHIWIPITNKRFLKFYFSM